MKKVLHDIKYIYYSLALGFWVVNNNFNLWQDCMRLRGNGYHYLVTLLWEKLSYNKTFYEADY